MLSLEAISSKGAAASTSSMKSPRVVLSSPTGSKSETGSGATLLGRMIFSTVRPDSSASSASFGLRPSRLVRLVSAVCIWLMVSIMWTGTRMVRLLSAIARVMAWRIHQVA